MPPTCQPVEIVVFNSSNTTLNLSQTGFNHGSSVTLSGAVHRAPMPERPTGDVAFIVSQGAIGWPVDPGTGAPARECRFRHAERRILFRHPEQPAGRHL